MKVRYAKKFTGTKTEAKYEIVLQYFDSSIGRWVDVKEEWATKEDQNKYESAGFEEWVNSIR